MRLKLAHCTVRSFTAADAHSLARHADDPEVWRTLRDQFPHPFSVRDAERFIVESDWTPESVAEQLGPWFEGRPPGESFGFDLKASSAL